jgi:hypothetical protein
VLRASFHVRRSRTRARPKIRVVILFPVNGAGPVSQPPPRKVLSTRSGHLVVGDQPSFSFQLLHTDSLGRSPTLPQRYEGYSLEPSLAAFYADLLGSTIWLCKYNIVSPRLSAPGMQLRPPLAGTPPEFPLTAKALRPRIVAFYLAVSQDNFRAMIVALQLFRTVHSINAQIRSSASPNSAVAGVSSSCGYCPV